MRGIYRPDLPARFGEDRYEQAGSLYVPRNARSVLFDDASSQYLSLADGLGLSTPLMLASWAIADAVGISQHLMSVGTSGSNNNRRSMNLNTTDNIQAVSRTTSGFSAITSTAISINTWFLAVNAYYSNTSRAAWLNGGGKGTESTSNAPSAPNQVTIGATNQPGVHFSGRIGPSAIWRYAPTDDDVRRLGGGMSFLQLAPWALVEYWPDPSLPGLIRGLRFTRNNGPTVAPGPWKIPDTRGHSRIGWARRPATSGDVLGDASITLPALTVSAGAQVQVQGELTKSFPALTLSAAAVVDVQAELTKNLPALTITSAGAVDVQAVLAKNLPALTIVATASGGDVLGDASLTFPPLASSAAGAVQVQAAASLTLPALAITATASEGTAVLLDITMSLAHPVDLAMSIQHPLNITMSIEVEA